MTTTDTEVKPSSTRDVTTSYERVKQLLDIAYANANVPSYQGLGDFWNTLSYQDFLSFQLYGEKLIADKPLVSCCGKAKSSRAEASALVKGLKGEFPFNGEQFPALPWAGKKINDSDIAYIETWINEDCPIGGVEQNHTILAQGTPSPSTTMTMMNPLGLSGQISPSLNMNAFKSKNNEPKQRKNADNLTDEEVCKLREAFRWARNLNAWPRDKRSLYSWGKLHGDVCAHGFEQFLTWHRMFLYDFEKNLQDFDPDVTLPFWDWTTPEYDVNRTQPKTGESGIIPKIFRCFITEQAIKELRDQYGLPATTADKLMAIVGQDFNSGVALFEKAGIDGEEYTKNAAVIVKKLEDINPLWYNARYPNMFYKMNADQSGFELEPGQSKPTPADNGLRGFHHHFPAKQDVDNLLALEYWRDFAGGPSYNQAFGLVDMEPHNTIHIWVGGYNPNFNPEKAKNNDAEALLDTNLMGDMLNNLTAGFDPIFWPHHVNIDRIFYLWQQRHPNQVPYDSDAALIGLGYNTKDALNVEALGYEYVDAAQAYLCADLMVEQSGVLPLPAETINKTALTTCRRVELRLHGVNQPEASLYIHAFVNEPNIGADTPTQENTAYAGYASLWGHGRCVGGPGHCAIPESEPNKFDLRAPNHNSKRNLTLDITQAVRAAMARGDTSIQVTLRTLDASLTRLADGLCVDALSINYVN